MAQRLHIHRIMKSYTYIIVVLALSLMVGPSQGAESCENAIKEICAKSIPRVSGLTKDSKIKASPDSLRRVGNLLNRAAIESTELLKSAFSSRLGRAARAINRNLVGATVRSSDDMSVLSKTYKDQNLVLGLAINVSFSCGANNSAVIVGDKHIFICSSYLNNLANSQLSDEQIYNLLLSDVLHEMGHIADENSLSFYGIYKLLGVHTFSKYKQCLLDNSGDEYAANPDIKSKSKTLNIEKFNKQFNELSADFWLSEGLANLLKKGQLDYNQKIELLSASLSQHCQKGAGEEHPSGRFRMKNTMFHNPAFQEALGCRFEEASTPSCSLQGAVTNQKVANQPSDNNAGTRVAE